MAATTNRPHFVVTDPLATAREVARLMAEEGLTQAQAGTRVTDAQGRPLALSRSATANLLRLLKLPDPILELLESGRLTQGQGRVLLASPACDLPERERLALAQRAARGRWSGRRLATEARKVAGIREPGPVVDPDVSRLVDELNEWLMARRLDVRHREDGGGEMVIHYGNADELEGILERMRRGDPQKKAPQRPWPERPFYT